MPDLISGARKRTFSRYMIGSNELAISTLQQTAALWRKVTLLLTINISSHY